MTSVENSHELKNMGCLCKHNALEVKNVQIIKKAARMLPPHHVFIVIPCYQSCCPVSPPSSSAFIQLPRLSELVRPLPYQTPSLAPFCTLRKANLSSTAHEISTIWISGSFPTIVQHTLYIFTALHSP